MKVRAEIDFSPSELDRIAFEASRFGWMRENPRKPWTDKERKEAARYAIERIVALHFDSFA